MTDAERAAQEAADKLAYARVLARKLVEPEGSFNPEQVEAYEVEVRYLLTRTLHATIAALDTGKNKYDVATGIKQACVMARMLYGPEVL